VSQKADWKRFVERRHRELRDTYPCATVTRRIVCPRHRIRVGPVTGLCKPCFDQFYEQVAAEYVAAKERQEGDAA
jgi:hypothetical protein